MREKRKARKKEVEKPTNIHAGAIMLSAKSN